VCRECEECPRQVGEPCSGDRPCDKHKGLVCRYMHGDSEGVCRGEYLLYLAVLKCESKIIRRSERARDALDYL
jgi:hypothetical protein